MPGRSGRHLRENRSLSRPWAGRRGLRRGGRHGQGPAGGFSDARGLRLPGGVATGSGSSSPGEVLALVNEAALARFPPNMFVTCFYAILEPESGRLLYANAGHTLPCRKRRNDDQAEELSARGMPLGLMSGMSYEEKETILLPGDVVLFCSDGLVEAHDPRGEMFGFPSSQRLPERALREWEGLSAALMEELESFTGEG